MAKKQVYSNEILKNSGLKSTPGRVAIIDVLANSPAPLTQEQIATQLGKQGLNKVTIYRALESFIKAGVIHKVYLQNRIWHFELAHNCTQKQCHPHFTCTRCGATRCMPHASVPMVTGVEQGYTVHRQTVQLEGLCPACTEK